LNGVFIKEYKSLLDASIQTKINKSSIGKCCKNIYKTAGGYIWKYTEESQDKIKKIKETTTELKTNILKLLNEGKRICEITKILNCDIAIVRYHKK